MAFDPIKEQAATLGAFGRSASEGLQRVGERIPKQVDTSRWGNLSTALSGPTDISESPQPQSPGQASWVSDSGADLSKLGTLTTPYGTSTRYEKSHPGIDVAAPIGTPIPILRSGVVVSVSQGHKHGEKGSFGNRMGVKDSQGNTWYYSHLDKSWVKVGQQVVAGQYGGTMGNTGSTYSPSGGSGSHLDLRIMDAYGKFINPKYLGIRS